MTGTGGEQENENYRTPRKSFYRIVIHGVEAGFCLVKMSFDRHLLIIFSHVHLDNNLFVLLMLVQIMVKLYEYEIIWLSYLYSDLWLSNARISRPQSLLYITIPYYYRAF